MSVLQSIQAALAGTDFPVGAGKYPDTGGYCGKIIFVGQNNGTSSNKSMRFMGGGENGIEIFKIVIRGESYLTLEQKASAVKNALKVAGYIQIGSYEDIEPKEGEQLMQLAVSFKTIK